MCPRADADETLDDDEMVEDGDPNLRGAEPDDDDDDGWGDVETELEVILIDVTVVEPTPVPAVPPGDGSGGAVVTDTSVEVGPPNDETEVDILELDGCGRTTTDGPPPFCFKLNCSPNRLSSTINRPLASSKVAIFCCCI